MQKFTTKLISKLRGWLGEIIELTTVVLVFGALYFILPKHGFLGSNGVAVPIAVVFIVTATKNLVEPILKRRVESRLQSTLTVHTTSGDKIDIDTKDWESVVRGLKDVEGANHETSH